MAADLDPLIRYRRHGLEEKQRMLAQLYRQAETLLQRKRGLQDQMAQEIQATREMGDHETSIALGHYLESVRVKIKAVEADMVRLDRQIARAQEEMRAAFAEMKKIEITQRNREAREEKAQQKKETNEFDDIGIEGHRRRSEE